MVKEELDRILNTICRQQAPVTVISVDSGAIGRGRFKTVSGKLVSIDLLERPDGFHLQRFSQCVCLFRQGDGGCAFLTSVQSFETHCSPAILFLHRPEDAACESRRRFARVLDDWGTRCFGQRGGEVGSSLGPSCLGRLGTPHQPYPRA